jgi:hypothetical protein
MRLGVILSVLRGSGVSGGYDPPQMGWAHKEDPVYRGMKLSRESWRCNCSSDRQAAQWEEQLHMTDMSWLMR